MSALLRINARYFFLLLLYIQIQIYEVKKMKKTTQINIRLSDDEYQILKSTADKYSMTLSAFILSILIPFCIRSN